ncbi:hypothetical protein ACIOHB_37245 [Streptomyces microflavus]|uniref:hypothetical protein n=1 Tax=Streptomyces microflavus TaxID=1919 RepID=UPI0038192D57
MPDTTAGMDEESIRDLLLVMLNDRFEGNVAGEVFNGAGKTDILVRERDAMCRVGVGVWCQ